MDAATNKEHEMMTGTEKQIAWAKKIRTEAAARIDELCAPNKIGKELGRRGVRPQRDLNVTDITSMLAWVHDLSTAAKTINDATWWIDHRESAGFQAVQKILNIKLDSAVKKH